MTKKDALRLRRGDHIDFGHSQWTADHLDSDWRTGEVLAVTPRGGIRVRAYGSREPEWVPYNWVLAKIEPEEYGTTVMDRR